MPAGSSSSIISKVNYGVVLKKVATIDVVTETWRHSFVVNLPDVSSRIIQRRGVNCARIATDVRQCTRLKGIVEYLHNITTKAVVRVHNTMRYIRQIAPQYVSPFNFTRKRGLLDIRGVILHGLFGVAKVSDVEHVRDTIQTMRRQNIQAISAWHESISRLSSFTSATNQRLDTMNAMVQSQRQTIERLFDDIVNETRDLTQTANLIAAALNKFEDFVLVLDDLEKFSGGLEALSHGFLSPSLVSPTELYHTLRTLSDRLRRLDPQLRVLRTRASHYYGSHNFIAARFGNAIIINLQVPISHMSNSLHLYQVHIVPVPLSGGQSHATFLQNVPKYIAYRPGSEYYMQFENEPKIRTSNLLYLEDTHGLLQADTNQSCILSIINDKKTAVKDQCLTTFNHICLSLIDLMFCLLTSVTLKLNAPLALSKTLLAAPPAE